MDNSHCGPMFALVELTNVKKYKITDITTCSYEPNSQYCTSMGTFRKRDLKHVVMTAKIKVMSPDYRLLKEFTTYLENK